MLTHLSSLPGLKTLFVEGISPNRQRVLPAGGDQFVRFGANRRLMSPTTMQASRFRNEGVPIYSVRELVERIDELMTVTGEVYSANEAFTGMLHVKIKEPHIVSDVDDSRSGTPLYLNLESQVEHTDGSRMILGTCGELFEDGRPLIEAKASFSAIDHNLLKTQKTMTPVAVAPLKLEAGDLPVNQNAQEWNNQLFAFYKKLGNRLKTRDDMAILPELRNVQTHTQRMKKTNVYVRTDMLNKKQTGHGGIAAALALEDMRRLTRNYDKYFRPGQLVEFTAQYLKPFGIEDALQYDTTIDYMGPNQEMVLSTRISKLDTKSRKAEGPIILVHAKYRPDHKFEPLLPPVTADVDADARRYEAQDWLKALG